MNDTTTATETVLGTLTATATPPVIETTEPNVIVVETTTTNAANVEPHTFADLSAPTVEFITVIETQTDSTVTPFVMVDTVPTQGAPAEQTPPQTPEAPAVEATTKEDADVQATNEASAPDIDHVEQAYEMVTGRIPFDANAEGKSIRAAHKDLNGKGRGDWWYRMVYRDGSWTYFAEEKLPMGTFLASDRRATVRGEVFPGELVCQHDKGGKVDGMWLIVEGDEDAATWMEDVKFTKKRDGTLSVTLPNGSKAVVSNPRK